MVLLYGKGNVDAGFDVGADGEVLAWRRDRKVICKKDCFQTGHARLQIIDIAAGNLTFAHRIEANAFDVGFDTIAAAREALVASILCSD